MTAGAARSQEVADCSDKTMPAGNWDGKVAAAIGASVPIPKFANSGGTP